MTIRTYVALVHQAHKKASFGVKFPDFPGCVFAGKSIDQALDKAKEGLIFHIEGLQANGDKIPQPSTLEKILANPENKAAITSLIRIVMSTGESKRLNISMDTGLINEIDRYAKNCGMNRSEFLAQAAMQCF